MTASLRVSNLNMDNHHNIPNSFQGDPTTPTPGVVNFEVRWQPTAKRFSVTDAEAKGFAGDFVQTKASLSWSAKQEDFTFTSDAIDTSSDQFSLLGSERNGVNAAPPASSTILIGEAGFDPPNARVARGGSVTWTNTGRAVHNVKEAPGSHAGFDSGGLGAGDTYTFAFNNPGTYFYTSSIDCGNPNTSAGFNCTMGTVNVS